MSMYNPRKPFNEQIEEMICHTWQSKYVQIRPGPIIIKQGRYSCTCDIDHTDGIGTKGYYHWRHRSFREAVTDAMAMNLNDLAMMRAIPYKIQNHIILPLEDKKALFNIMTYLVEECYRHDIAITGGETSIQDTLDGIEISITMGGMIGSINHSGDWEFPPENLCQNGDLLLGFSSNGLHSNGFTRVRKLLGEATNKLSILTTCTAKYNTILKLIENNIPIHGMMHITGGAFTKLKRILGNNDAIITNAHKLKPHDIFNELHSFGLSDEEMYETFNCGIGFIISVPANADLSFPLMQYGVDVIGHVVKGNRNVCIQSYFTGHTVNY